MAALSIAAAQGVQGLSSGILAKSRADTSAVQNEIEADKYEEMAAEVYSAGEKKMALYSEKLAKYAAASEAAIARKHIDLGSGLAKAIKNENRRVADLDLLAMQNNIMNNALKYKFQAQRSRLQADLDRSAGKEAFWTNLASGIVKGGTSYAISQMGKKDAPKLTTAQRASIGQGRTGDKTPDAVSTIETEPRPDSNSFGQNLRDLNKLDDFITADANFEENFGEFATVNLDDSLALDTTSNVRIP